MILRTLVTAVAFVLALPTAALAQVIDPMPPIPCPWWDCGQTGPVVIQDYRMDTTIEGPIATTRITQVLRNEGGGLADGQFLMPIPADAAVTGLTLWIDGEPVSGELLDGEAARRTYEQIVRDTLDPALLEYVDDDLLRLSVFPIPEGATRTVEVQYRQVLATDAGLVRYRQPLGREHHGVEIEHVVARIEIHQPDGLKAVHSPTHAIALDRLSDTAAVVGFEGSGTPDHDFALYFSTDAGPVSLDVVSYRDGEEGWFLMLASPGLAPTESVTAKDLVLVLDVSGSMEGEKLAQARAAARAVLDDLNPEDRFEILAFSTGTDSYADGLRPASDAAAAREWVGRLAAGGSTNIHQALSEAFALGEPGRPLYVLFLTDGLPTEGLVDTADILGALPDSETTSVFAFGVGYDVDTVLLDSIARDHHGTTEYVVPGEEIDTAMDTLSAKIASPVMTAVQLTVEGVTISDLYPTPLPDVFSGGQLVLAGRYEGYGPAVVTLSGRIDGEPVDLAFDDVSFAERGGDDSVPGLWATRKVGELLRRIRIDGPDEETIDQIVRLSIRYGIVTPYTSYLVTEPAPFGADALDEISRQAVASTTTLAPSGEAAVAAADFSAGMAATDKATGAGEFSDVVVTAGGRTLRLTDGVWVDTTFDPGMVLHRIAFASDDYFALAATSPAVRDILATGPRVIVVVDGAAYEVITDGGATDPLPEFGEVGAAGTVTSTSTPATIAAIDPAAVTEPQSASPLIAILAGLAAAGALALLVTRRN